MHPGPLHWRHCVGRTDRRDRVVIRRCTEGRNNAWPAGRAMRSVNSSYGAERCIEGVREDFTTAMRRVGLDPVRPVWLGEFFA